MENWFKSSFSTDAGGDCIEVAFRGATRCGESGHCVEVGTADNRVLVRDSKAGDSGPVLSFSIDTWNAFIAGVKGGEFTGER